MAAARAVAALAAAPLEAAQAVAVLAAAPLEAVPDVAAASVEAAAAADADKKEGPVPWDRSFLCMEGAA